MPLVSIVVPVRNGERHLAGCLRSITAQTLNDIEVIVVDDGSTDATAEIIAGFVAKDPRVRGLPGPATGSAGDARNAGLAIATGDYLAFWDSDDQFGPTLLNDLWSRARADDADLVLTKFRIADGRTGQAMPVEWGVRLDYFPDHTPVSPDELGDHLLIAVNPAPWNKLFRAEFIREQGLRFQSLTRANDVYFVSMALVLARRIGYLDGYAIDYRVGAADSLQSTLDDSPLEFVKALGAVRAGIRGAGRWPELERSLVNQTVELSLTALRKAGSAAAFESLHHELRDRVFPHFDVVDRPAGYFLRREYAKQVNAIMHRSTAELLFARLSQAQSQAERAKADARSVLLGLGAPPAPVPVDTAAAAMDLPPRAPLSRSETEPQPDVSVVIPVYNTERYLRECLTSACAQTGVTLQIICVDDGSTDGSQGLLAELAQQDSRILVLHQEHAGQSVARNLAMDQATGRYVCFLDSDDFWQLDRLAELVRQLDADHLDLLMFDAVTLREPGVSDRLWSRLSDYYERPDGYGEPTDGPSLLARLKTDGYYRASACLALIRRELFVEHGLRFFPGIKHEDNLFTFAALLAARRAAHRPVALYGRRLRPGSTMSASVRAIAVRGYFVCVVEMLRLVRGRQFEAEIATQVGAVIHRAFQHARNDAAELDPDLITGLGALYPHDPDAQVLTALIHEARSAAQLAATAKSATVPALPPPTPLERAERRARRTVKDVIRRTRRLSSRVFGRVERRV